MHPLFEHLFKSCIIQDENQTQQVLEYKFGSIENIDEEHFQNLTTLLTDLYFYATHAYAEMLTAQGITVYQYLFSYRGNNYYCLVELSKS